MARLHRMDLSDPVVRDKAQQVSWVTIHRVCGEISVSRSIGDPDYKSFVPGEKVDAFFIWPDGHDQVQYSAGGRTSAHTLTLCTVCNSQLAIVRSPLEPFSVEYSDFTDLLILTPTRCHLSLTYFISSHVPHTFAGVHGRSAHTRA